MENDAPYEVAFIGQRISRLNVFRFILIQDVFIQFQPLSLLPLIVALELGDNEHLRSDE